MLIGKSRGQLLIAPERMKRLDQSRNNAQLLDVSGGESKVQCCKEQYCREIGMLGPGIKVNWGGQVGDGKNEDRHLRNQ